MYTVLSPTKRASVTSYIGAEDYNPQDVLDLEAHLVIGKAPREARQDVQLRGLNLDDRVGPLA